MRTTSNNKMLNSFNALCLYMIGDSIGAVLGVGVVKVAITVNGPPSEDAGLAVLRFCDATVRTHCVRALCPRIFGLS